MLWGHNWGKEFSDGWLRGTFKENFLLSQGGRFLRRRRESGRVHVGCELSPNVHVSGGVDTLNVFYAFQHLGIVGRVWRDIVLLCECVYLGW